MESFGDRTFLDPSGFRPRSDEAVGTLHRRQSFPRCRELGGQAFELFEVESRECLETLGAIFGEMQSDHPMVLVVSGAGDQTGRVGPVDEPDRTVMEQEEVVGHLPNGRAAGIAVPTYGQEKLVLGGRQASRLVPAARSSARNDVARFATRAGGHRPHPIGSLASR